MRRTWFWSLALTFLPAAAFAQYGAPLQPAPAPAPAPATAAPAPAPAPAPATPPPVGADYGAGVAVAPAPAPMGGEVSRQGFELAARMMLLDATFLRQENDPSNNVFHGWLDPLPRLYAGYHLAGKLAIMLGLNLINTSSAGGELLTEEKETAALGWSIAPGVTYELVSSVSANLTLELFGTIVYGGGSASFKNNEAEVETEWSWTTTGIDLGARISHWFSPGFGAGFDLGLTYAKTSGTKDGTEGAVADNGDESAEQVIAIYSALELTGILLP